ncbi:hypothetical protein [Cytobacillus oceanisediminis]|uniref:hypothetical protein n=1 Tax=Cytobacillus oceanisediminis TaxID=665099 RepID=UPI00207AC03E|nr:hypothetical protein [Cytobacillus oceanisediminis]USK45509.1 hypothetical protein LIT27_06580 [Cytobacillus oceanisediminis]
MDMRYRVFDTEDDDLFVCIQSHYFQLSDAKVAYMNSKKTDEKDDTILLRISKRNADKDESVLAFGVEEGEKFALALLNLCNSIKY